MKTFSLTRRLIGGVLIAELLCAALFSFVALEHEMHGRKRAFDVMLRGRGDSLMGAVQDAEDPEDNVDVDPTELAVPKEDLYAVLSPSGRTLGQSPDSPAAALASLKSPHKDGYFDFRVHGQRYRAIRFQGMRVIDRDDHGGLRRPVTILYAAPTRNLWHGAVEAAQFYIGSSVVLVALTGVALIWFLRRRLSSLEELANAASRVSAQCWDFSPPEEALRTAELAPIAHSIDELLKGLYQAFQRQRQLTGDAAHELKTSIAVLKSSAQLLTMSRRTTEQYEAGLENLLTDTERMEDLAARMLALARLEETPSEQAESCDLAAALRRVAIRVQPLTAMKTADLSATVAEQAWVGLPADDADVLCSNLLLNALQHSRPNGRISATVQACGGSVELHVNDDGEGIPASALPHVFERFYRADRSRSRNSGGAGLGLSICKAIVDRAHGAIRIASVEGEGTKVSVTLPETANEPDAGATINLDVKSGR